MTLQRNTSIYISRLAISLIMLTAYVAMHAQNKIFAVQKDTVPFFKGFSISIDLAGPVMRTLGDYGEYEASLRINLHNQYFPIFEIGYGSAKHDDEVTSLYYKTQAPYFRIGCDLNLLKNKHTGNRMFGGLRYAFTSYKVDIAHPGMQDPVWGWDTSFSITGETCSQHWIEAVFGIDAKIWGPLHLGWNVRYKRRIAHKDSSVGNTWYIPGYGKYGDTRIGANFNVIIDI
ncbi:DUF6048 family protein [Xylanibacter muris]|nr:DUF6048 family protein [Xylanibacter muris]